MNPCKVVQFHPSKIIASVCSQLMELHCDGSNASYLPENIASMQVLWWLEGYSTKAILMYRRSIVYGKLRALSSCSFTLCQAASGKKDAILIMQLERLCCRIMMGYTFDHAHFSIWNNNVLGISVYVIVLHERQSQNRVNSSCVPFIFLPLVELTRSNICWIEGG